MRVFGWASIVAVVVLLLAGCGGAHRSSSSNYTYVYTTPTPAPVAAVLDQAGPLCDAAFRRAASGAKTAGAMAHGPVLTLLELDESEIPASARDTNLDRWLAASDPDITGVPLAQIATAADSAQALVCVIERQVQVGSFEISGSPAVRIDYDVRLLSWPDGAVVAATSLTGGDPPSERTVSAACRANPDGDGCHDPIYGPSPASDLRTWLSQLLGGGH